MRAVILAAVVTVSALAATSSAFAGARSPGGFSAPPTNEQIRNKLYEICSSLLQEEDKLSVSVSNSRCLCYSNGVVKAMSNPEIDEMRVTGRFAPSAQPKARKFMTSCKIKG